MKIPITAPGETKSYFQAIHHRRRLAIAEPSPLHPLSQVFLLVARSLD